MARKKKRKTLRTFFLLFCSVVVVWLFVFLAWLFWPDLEEVLVSKGKKVASQKAQAGPGRERISEPDRKRLEEILKKR